MALRIGFIGSGGIARHHMKTLADLAEGRMVAFADVAEERARGAATEYSGTAYTDFRQMLDREQLDAVWICLPPFAHPEAELEAAQRRLPFFLEKPIATNMETARQVSRAVTEAGLTTAVGYHWRWYDTTDRARELLSTRTVGMALGYWMGGMPGVGWWRRLDGSGGQFVEQTTHIVDLARYLCGEVTEVYAAFATQALQDVPDFSVWDVGTVTLKFASGAVGQIANTCLLNQGYTVALHVVTPDLILEHSGSLRVLRGGKAETIRPAVNPTELEDRTFLQAVQSGDASAIRSPYDDALKTLAVTLAANESAQTGRAVPVPNA
jgi:myo-inositol 2-dehydrogenase / D-chiro-inositol 1-dehydrogenase